MNSDPLWYKNAVIYQAHIKAYCDGNGDGTGDFKGLISKLDYLQELGITAIWLLPFYPSPLRDDGYDIADYRNVHPRYGTMTDFKRFLAEAHRRGLRVITELVLNHTSDQHPWFQRARRARPGSVERDFYVWNESPDKYKETRIIFKDFEPSNWTWDPVAKAYYWHRFYRHQPDLNFDNPAVAREMFRIIDFWLEMGVDGFRLDAVPYLYEREGTHCENLPQVHAFLKKLRAYVDRRYPGRMLLAEANQWPKDSRAYFGRGDECQMAFHFPVMPRLYLALQKEDRFPIVDILNQTPPIPANCQWAIFLRNHDELTLEMVTEEERDYLWRVYAKDKRARINLGIRRRLSPLMNKDRRRLELMNTLLFSLPGSPVIYYGDEIGMGDDLRLPDRDGVRTPMQWTPGKNAGFSLAKPSKLYLPVITAPEYHYKTTNVEVQKSNPESLYHFMRRMIALRKQYPVFGQGSMRMLQPSNEKILAFVRHEPGQAVLVVANLSRFAQTVDLDLAPWAGCRPVELMGMTPFPEIGRTLYRLTLGPHDFYWFVLEKKKALPRALPDYLARRRWFRGKSRVILETVPRDSIPIPSKKKKMCWLLEEVRFSDGEPQFYSIPLKAGKRPAAPAWRDASGDPDFARWLIKTIAGRAEQSGAGGSLRGVYFGKGRINPEIPASVLPGDQSNTSIRYGTQWIVKLFRQVDEGKNPDIEIRQALQKEKRFSGFPPVMGSLEYRLPGREPMVLAVLERFVPNQGTAWDDLLREALRKIGSRATEKIPPQIHSWSGRPLMQVAREPFPDSVSRWLGDETAGRIQRLGKVTAELHQALSRVSKTEGFSPEPFGELYQQSLVQSLRSSALLTLRRLERSQGALPENKRALVKQLTRQSGRLLRLYENIRRINGKPLRVRCHGDFHLGQVLKAGREWVVIDFEGEPARSIGERRLKTSPMKDIAGMIRSFDYAAWSAWNKLPAARRAGAKLKTEAWSSAAAAAYLNGYLGALSGNGFLSESDRDNQIILDVYLMDKALYELSYEMNNRPDWVEIPLRGILKLLELGGISSPTHRRGLR